LAICARFSRSERICISMSDPLLEAMEVQMRSEREKRAQIAKSEGEMESKINYSQGAKEEAVNKSEGEKQRFINEAEGQAQEILSLARASAASINKIASSMQHAGGEDAAALQISEQYIEELRKLAKPDTRLILPMNIGDIRGSLDQIQRVLRHEGAARSE
jgi:regulator of protease activity HflC (stomatin/prohibitin superfamily)